MSMNIFNLKKKWAFSLLLVFNVLLPFLFMQINPNSLFLQKNEVLTSETILKSSSNHPPNAHYFEYYKEIIVNHNKVEGAENHSNFPLLIEVYDQDLHDDVQEDGDDIAFSNGTDWLDHELEVFNQNFNNTHSYLVVWVKITNLFNDINTIVYMYFGNSTMNAINNPTNVWSNFTSVWHLEESSGSGAYLKDSTKNNYDGTPSGTQFLANAKIGGARNFEADSDEININSGSNLFDGSNQFVFSFWLYPNYASDLEWENDLEKAVFYKQTSVRMARMWRYDWEGAGIGRFQADIEFSSYGTIYANVDINRQVWNHIVYSYNGTHFFSYVNGQQKSSIVIGIDNLLTDSSDFTLGSPGNNCFDGYIDEFRISENVNKDGWYKTEYNNQNDPDSFYNISNAKKIYASENDFNYFKIISIDHTKVSGTDDLIDFPLLISIFDSDLHSSTQEDGDDIAFSDSTGSEWLAHEIELYSRDYNSSHAQLIAWVRIPVLSIDVDTEIRMYYGNDSLRAQEFPKGVWNQNYVAVWHLKENPTNSILDSSVNNFDGIASGSMNSFDQVEGQIDGSLDFDGNNDHIQIGTIPSNYWNAITLEAWILMNDGGDDRVISKEEGTGGGPHIWMLGKTSSNLKCRITTDGTNGGFSEIQSSGGLQTGTWHYIAMKWDAVTHNFCGFIDGNLTNQVERLGDGITDSIADTILADQAAGVRQFDGIISEARISNYAYSNEWIQTQYRNQNSPSSFFSVGIEQSKTIILKVNTLDLYSNRIPNLNVSIYQNSEFISSSYTDDSGIASFNDVNQGSYNFTVRMESNLGDIDEIVNKTVNDFYIDENNDEVNLVCKISSNFFQVFDTDSVPLNSGWIIVGNSSQNLMNCSIDQSGSAHFWWLNTTPYEYNYSIYYEDINYNPRIINLDSGSLDTVNETIIIKTYLTTVNFLVKGSGNLVSGARLLLRREDNLLSIVNLTTTETGRATLRWINSSGFIKGMRVNYSLRIDFFGSKLFNSTTGGVPDTLIFNFTVKSQISYEFIININPDDFQTNLISLNPTDNVIVEWGTQLKIRTLFNVSKAGDPPIEDLLGPAVADSVQYTVLDGETELFVGELESEVDKIGRYQGTIDTKLLESDKSYLIEISALKSGFTLPTPLNVLLFVRLKHLYLNESNNNDDPQDVYWLESANMSVRPYGEDYEEIYISDEIFVEDDNSFRFSLPSISTSWNLTSISFNLREITFGVSQSEIYVNITDPNGVIHSWDENNAAFYYESGDPGNGSWSNLAIDFNYKSRFLDNSFNFLIEGSFVGTFQVVAEAIFLRDKLDVCYQQFNISNYIKIPSTLNGWGIKNITFEIYNCRDPNNWALLNPKSIIDNITTNEGIGSSYFFNDQLGYAKLNFNNTFIHPLEDFYTFFVANNSDIIFDLNIFVEFFQFFYKNSFIESINLTKQDNNFESGFNFKITPEDVDWNEVETVLLVKNLKDESLVNVFPSEVLLNLNIEGYDYNVADSPIAGQATISIFGLSRDIVFSGLIEANQSISLDLYYQIIYKRIIQYDLRANINYQVEEAPSITGLGVFNADTRSYDALIDSSLLNSFTYTIRFTSYRENYDVGIKELRLNVLERITMINNSLGFHQSFIEIYIRQSKNFSLSYTDFDLGTIIEQLDNQDFIWEYYGDGDTILESGGGNLLISQNYGYIIDFNTENRSAGRYSIIATFNKQNYQSKIAIISLSILKRPITYSLDDNFRGSLVSVVKGNTISIDLNLSDSIDMNSPIENATISILINGKVYNFEEYASGAYRLEFSTDNVTAFFTSKTLIGSINITKEDYISEYFSITIVVEMEQIFPGFPTFYFILLISLILLFASVSVGYRFYKVAKIPKFVKKVRSMQKAIKNDKDIIESVVYPEKIMVLGEMMKDTWRNIGIPIESILGVEIKKSRKLEASKKIAKMIKKGDQKPVGLILMRWNERSGTEIMTKYPHDINVTSKSLMQVYSTHEYSGDKGIITLTTGSLNIVSYYSGPESGYYLILLLNIDDDPDVYESGLIDMLHIIVRNLEDDSYLNLFPSLFQRLSEYPSLNQEQIIALNYQDEIKHTILEILREEGVVAKSELIIWLKDKLTSSFFDIDAILLDLMKYELIKQVSIKGIPSELIMLINDLFIFRIPPIELIKNAENKGLPAELQKEYYADVKKFFENYKPTAEGNKLISKIIIDPQAYEILRLLRNSIVTHNELEKLKKKGVDDIYGALKVLWDAQIIKVYQDRDKKEYYALLSDIYVDIKFPKYLLNIIKSSYEQKSKANKVLIDYLDALEDTYLSLKS